jgi:hypothetical protein
VAGDERLRDKASNAVSMSTVPHKQLAQCTLPNKTVPLLQQPEWQSEVGSKTLGNGEVISSAM